MNERGFWESELVNALDDELFSEAGMSWFSLQQVPRDVLGRTRLRELRRRANEILIDEFDATVQPVIKDPRMCRLLALWQPVFAKLAARTVYPIALRNPLEVASSLARRNDFELDLGLMLWARYYLDAEAQTRGLQRAIISYERLVDNWPVELARLRQRLGLTEGDDSAVGEYLSGELRHHRHSDRDIRAALERIPLLAETYGILEKWAATGSEDEADYQRLDAARQHLDALNPLLANMFEGERRDRKRRASSKAQADEIVARLDHRIDGLGGVVERLLSTVSDRSAVESSLKDALNRCVVLEERIARLERNGDESRAEIRRQVAELRGRDEDLARARDDTRNVGDQLKTVTRKYRSNQEILERERTKHKELRARLAQAEATVGHYRSALPSRILCWHHQDPSIRKGASWANHRQRRWQKKISTSRAPVILPFLTSTGTWKPTPMLLRAASIRPAITSNSDGAKVATLDRDFRQPLISRPMRTSPRAVPIRLSTTSNMAIPKAVVLPSTRLRSGGVRQRRRTLARLRLV